VPRRRSRISALLFVCFACVPFVLDAQSPPSAAPADPFARGGWNLELLGQALAEAWNYNANHEDLFGLSTGFTYGVRDGLMFIAATPMFNVTQRTSNAALIAITGGIRKRIARIRQAAGFVELAVGVSRAEGYVPPRGTQFNYVFQPGLGMTMPLGDHVHLVAGLRWLHLSNNSLAGRNRNPDIEAIGLNAGILLPF
jgi:hypothetical protein